MPYFVFPGSNLVLDTTFRRSKTYRSRALWTRTLLFNLAPIMAREADRRRVYFHAAQGSEGIGHWNAEGRASLLPDGWPRN